MHVQANKCGRTAFTQEFGGHSLDGISLEPTHDHMMHLVIDSLLTIQLA